MIKKIISVALAMLLFGIQVEARSLTGISFQNNLDEIVNFNEGCIYNVFEPISELVDEIEAGVMVNSDLILRYNTTLPTDDVEWDDPSKPLGISSFLWGCVLGIWGVVLVYIFTDKSKVEAKKAMNGCITSYAIVGLVYGGFIIWAATTGATTYSYSTY